MPDTLIGFGYDVHRLAPGESLVLGGIAIPSETGTVAHSDGDVLLHALCDALLGAAGMGDIGEHFPDTDQKWKNAESSVFVRECMRMLKDASYRVVNADIAVVLEAPRLKAHKEAMREHIASLLLLHKNRVNIKATTSEKLGFVGKGEGIQAYCVCSVIAEPPTSSFS